MNSWHTKICQTSNSMWDVHHKRSLEIFDILVCNQAPVLHSAWKKREEKRNENSAQIINCAEKFLFATQVEMLLKAFKWEA